MIGSRICLQVGKDMGLFGRMGLFSVENNDTSKQDLGNPGA